MKSYTCEYALIDPETLVDAIEYAFPGSSALWIDVDEETFEVTVCGVIGELMDELDDVVAPTATPTPPTGMTAITIAVLTLTWVVSRTTADAVVLSFQRLAHAQASRTSIIPQPQQFVNRQFEQKLNSYFSRICATLPIDNCVNVCYNSITK